MSKSRTNVIEQPDGIIVTVSAGMIGDHGYRRWLRNFLDCMKKSEEPGTWNYYFRINGLVRRDKNIRYVYLCIGGKIRFRCYYAGCQGPGKLQLFNGTKYRIIEGKGWVLATGPVERAPMVIKRQGFQGFRYCEELW